MEAFLFWVLAIVGVVCGGMVVWHRNPMSSAIYLVITMLCLAGFYILLSGAFVAVIQVLVYAGAVMVLILFVIMMLNMPQETFQREGSTPAWIVAGGIGLLLVIRLTGLFRQGQPSEIPPPGEDFGTIQAVGAHLFGAFVLPFELTSVLLLVAIIGAVILAKRRTL
jgi:NADH-quinone oxidoreductase subunit J